MLIDNNVLINVDPNMETVIVPEGVEEIGYAAFKDSIASEVILPSTLLKIGPFAFAGCKNLTKLVLPEGLKTIDLYAFAFTNLKEINIPNSVTFINFYAFETTPFINDFKDEFIILGDGLLYLYLGESAEVTIPEGVKVICPLAFSKTNDFFEYEHGKEFPHIINLPSSLKRICKEAFYRVRGLEKLNFQSEVEIVEGAFNDCGLSTNF